MKTFLPCLIVFLLLIPASRAELPPDAQAAVNKGLLAAKAQEWKIAIQNFQEARKTAPTAPEIFGYLGLAESKIPGRELRAIAWFEAYLNAAPQADNAAAVRNQIASLELKAQANASHLIDMLIQMEAQLPRAERLGRVSDIPILGIIRLQACFGNPEGAIASLLNWPGFGGSLYLDETIQDLVENGCFAEAFQLIKQIQRLDEKTDPQFHNLKSWATSYDYVIIADEQSKQNLLEDARKTYALLSKDATAYRSKVLIYIAAAEFRTGQVDASKKTRSQAVTLANDSLGWVVTSSVDCGDLQGLQTLLHLLKDEDKTDFLEKVNKLKESEKSSSESPQTSSVLGQDSKSKTINEWIDLENGKLNLPIFMDFKTTLDNLPSSVPDTVEGNYHPRVLRIFYAYKQQAQLLKQRQMKRMLIKIFPLHAFTTTKPLASKQMKIIRELN